MWEVILRMGSFTRSVSFPLGKVAGYFVSKVHTQPVTPTPYALAGVGKWAVPMVEKPRGNGDLSQLSDWFIFVTR